MYYYSKYMENFIRYTVPVIEAHRPCLSISKVWKPIFSWCSVDDDDHHKPFRLY